MNNNKEKYQEIRKECKSYDFVKSCLNGIKSFLVELYRILHIDDVLDFAKGVTKFALWLILCSLIFFIAIPSAFLSFLLSKLTNEEVIYYVGSTNKYDDCYSILDCIFNKKGDN